MNILAVATCVTIICLFSSAFAQPTIEVSKSAVTWPEWVKFVSQKSWTVTITNNGDADLNITEIGVNETSGSSPGWLGVSQPTLIVPHGSSNTAEIDIEIDASGYSAATEWLDGEVYMKSDAANNDSLSIYIHVLVADTVEPVLWDTIATNPELYSGSPVPAGCVGLAVANNGEMGMLGQGGANLDFWEAGSECGTRLEDKIYLYAGSPYFLDADGAGNNVRLTLSYPLPTARVCSDWSFLYWAPLATQVASLSSGHSSGYEYDSVRVGPFINQDTSVALTRTFYGPRMMPELAGTVVVRTELASANGQSHENVTVGNLSNWDIPSDLPGHNQSGTSIPCNFVYMRGTDSTGSQSCQSHYGRLGTEVFLGWHRIGELIEDPCANNLVYWGAWGGREGMLYEDTLQPREGPCHLFPATTQDWWDNLGANPGNSGYTTREDQAIWLTYLYDYDLQAEDTLVFWTAYSTVRNGTLADLEGQIEAARNWYWEVLRPACITTTGTCCIGMVGNVNDDPDEKVTIGDIAALVNHLFIDKPELVCVLEADVNQSGGEEPTQINPGSDITIGDVALLTDYLFVTTPPIYGPLMTCF